ncbi:2-isopropylmalate synthase [Halioxenophilus sp. WMMB6]|uniref:2-isopropylmalate synthase n=1 Tax=Halioxenophilus sp. WMMB6 TaxID=3073815 RepID=UPI00295ECE63|nr:2-isopropylmalate synthase [Halioxenophilus sp. WMMB6]
MNTPASFNHKKYRRSPVINKPDRRWPSQVIAQAPIWCAVDLRDGNQALIEPMTVAQKQKLWKLLVKVGFKQIEIGFPSASQPDYDFCRWLIEENQIPDDVSIQVLVQAREELIARTFEALQGAKQAIVHVYNSTSPVQRDKVFGLEKTGIVDIARRGAELLRDYAARYPECKFTFEYSPESFSSTEIDFAIEVCNEVIEVWQPTPENKAIFNLPATVECATPNVFADQIETFCDGINRRDSIIVSVHTHNDRGSAVAAGELALMAGADRVEGTLMGNGERTGNMDVVTMGMNLYSQGIDPELDFANADEIVRVVSECTQIEVHPRHPWLGELVYTAFSGSHQDAIRKCLAKQGEEEAWDVAYLPIDPRDIGRDYQSVIRVNSQSGKGGVAYILEQEFGLAMPRWMQIEASRKVQAHAEQAASEVSSKQIWEIVKEAFMTSETGFQLTAYSLDRSNDHEAVHATLKNDKGEYKTIQGQGDGALSAFCHGIEASLGYTIEIVHYDQHAIGSGTDAQAIAYVQVKINGERFCGISRNQDVLSANLNAILICVNQAIGEGLQMSA